MTNESIILHEDKQLFSPISQLNYEYYTSKESLDLLLTPNSGIQCKVGNRYVPFGRSQQPGLTDFADGTDTLKFLLSL